MTIIDPIADAFTRLRNSLAVKMEYVDVPFSKLSFSIFGILKEEGFITNYEVIGDNVNKKVLRIINKYDKNGKPIINSIKKISKCGRRVYTEKSGIRKVQSGFGINILSTSKGILSGKSARLNNVGGEVIAEVF